MSVQAYDLLEGIADSPFDRVLAGARAQRVLGGRYRGVEPPIALTPQALCFVTSVLERENSNLRRDATVDTASGLGSAASS